MSHFSCRVLSFVVTDEDMESLTDLVVAAQAGDVEAYGHLVQATQTMAYGVAVGVLRDSDCCAGCRPAGLSAGRSAGCPICRSLRRFRMASPDRDYRRTQHAASQADDAAAPGRHPRRAGAGRGGNAMVGLAASSARVGASHADTRGASAVRPALSRAMEHGSPGATRRRGRSRDAQAPAACQGQVTQGD